MVKPFSVCRALKPKQEKKNGEEEEGERGGATHDPPKKYTPRTHPISLSWLLSTRPLNPPSSTLAKVDDREFTGPISTRPGADSGSAPSRSRHQLVDSGLTTLPHSA
ncbi:hypothetical protein LWI29_008563 [Acer saccharum]|uniref:Uncharacterized protein n=1 Tax=Acer saccharum TaxID=4024 RepID=A0AA39T112_ACESA|nr:hypothetical protein LWI29_008563 [Acer saccharum]